MAANMMPPGALSMPVQQAATAQQLGPFIKSYRSAIVGSIAGAIFCIVLGLAFGGFATQTGDGVGIAVCGLFALFFIVGGIVLISQVVQVAGQQIYLFQQGLIIENKGQLQVFPWKQTAEVFQSITRHYRNGIYTGTTYRYTLRRMDGYQIKLGNTTKGIAELGQAVARGVTQELVPRALHSLRAGQTLTFAQFSINLQGIGNGREFVPWPQVEAVNVNRGQVTIKKAGKFFSWGSAMVAKIPNFFVFLAVSEEMIRQTRGRAN